MKIKYRVLTSRPDERPSTHSEPEFEGKSVQECDEKALSYLTELGLKDSNAWENFSLERIDVEEKKTHIARNVPARHAPGAVRQTILPGEKGLAA